MWQSKSNKSGYGKFLSTHVCDLNHFQSSGTMESALSFFTESLAKYNVRYSHYIGDGDTESYKTVVKARSSPYGDDIVPIKIVILVMSKNAQALGYVKFDET